MRARIMIHARACARGSVDVRVGGRVMIIQGVNALDDHNGGPYLYYNYNVPTLHVPDGKDKFTSRSLIFRNSHLGCSINTEIDWDK